MMKKKRVLSWPQFHFVNSRAKFPAMVAGFGSGKTEAGCLRALRLKFQYPDQSIGYYLPTYSLIKTIVFPRIEEILVRDKVKYFLNRSDKELTIAGNKGKIIFRTMDNPELIIGYEHAHAITDELDILATDKAADVWRKIVARNREKLPDGSLNTIGTVTTPEGFRFVYEKWKRKPMIGSQIIKASTKSNMRNLPRDYIDTLRDIYPDAMLAAYLEGEFVNMRQGRVYPDYDRFMNMCFDRVNEKDILHIGMDFNVGKMAAVVHVMRNGLPCAVDEFTDLLDTPAMIKAIKNRYPGNRTIVYPDASGKSRRSNNAAASDIAQLRQAQFTVLARNSNPFVRDRLASMNKQIHKDGKRRYKVNADTCPSFVEALEKQAYDKNGDPDKTSGFDHLNDAAGYFINYKFPVTYDKPTITNLKGV